MNEELFPPTRNRVQRKPPGLSHVAVGDGTMHRGPEKLRIRPVVAGAPVLLTEGFTFNSVRDNDPSSVFQGDSSFRLADFDQVISGDTGVQLANVSLKGINGSNSDSGRTYWELTDTAGDRTLEIFSDAAHTSLVATGTITGDGTVTLNEFAGSGLTGMADITYTADDIDVGNELFHGIGEDNAEWWCFMKFPEPQIFEALFAFGFGYNNISVMDSSAIFASGVVGWELVFEDWDPATLNWNNKPTDTSGIISGLTFTGNNESISAKNGPGGIETGRGIDLWFDKLESASIPFIEEKIRYGVLIRYVFVNTDNTGTGDCIGTKAFIATSGIASLYNPI